MAERGAVLVAALGSGHGPRALRSSGMGRRWVLVLGLLLGVVVGGVNGFHSLRYFHVAVAEPGPGLPQFVAVGYLDGIPIARYDSNTGRCEPQREWMKNNLDQQYWDGQTQVGQNDQEVARVSLDRVRARFNESGRAQTDQHMYGCDLLDDNSTRGYYQTAVDGRDFIAFDMDTETFTAADPAAVITKRNWEKDGTEAERWKRYLKGICIEWLKRYLSYGRAELERKERPTVRVSGREAQGTLILSCRVSGFYPRLIGVSWLKGSEVREQDTQRGGIVPNSDGTFYTWASIEVLPQEREQYRCQVEHASLPEPGIFSWEPEPQLPLASLLGGVAAVAAVAAAVGIGIGVWKRRGQQPQKGYNLAAPDAKA